MFKGFYLCSNVIHQECNFQFFFSVLLHQSNTEHFVPSFSKALFKSNLGEEYDMRVILAQSPSLSYVSPIRMLRVPRPGEIGFGLSGGVSTTLRDAPQTALGGGANIENASFVLKIFVPLAIILFLLALVLTMVCCLRGPLMRESLIRRLCASKTSSSAQVVRRLNGCRVGDRRYVSAAATLEESRKLRKCKAANGSVCITLDTIDRFG